MKRLLLFIALVSVAHAAGSVQQNNQSIGNNVFAFSFNWVGDSVNGSVPATVAQGAIQLQGYRVISMETTPGTPAPTAAYSITLIDNAGVDIMAGAAVSLSNSQSQSFAGSPTAPPLYGSFTFTVTGNSVASAKGSAIVYLAPLSQVLGLSPTAPSFPAQGANLVFASPNGSSGSPGFRAVAVPGDFGANVQGNGSKVQLSTGTTTSQDCVKYDANGNAVDAGAPCQTFSLPAGTQTQFLRIQPNTGNNTTAQFTTPLLFNASDYNFPFYSCNGGLTCVQGGTSAGSLATGNNTLTLSIVPLGVNGTDANHLLYVSGGTGTAEACLITGGTGTSGGSGTIIINCANTHTGAWTLQSATGGIQEAHNVTGTFSGQEIRLPLGTTNIFGTITITNTIRLTCGSQGIGFNVNNFPVGGAGCTLAPQINGMTVIKTNGANSPTFDHFTVFWAAAQTTGKTFDLNGTQHMISYINFSNDWLALSLTSSLNDLIDHCRFSNYQSNAIFINFNPSTDQTGPIITNNTFDGSTTQPGTAIAIIHNDTGGVVVMGNGFHTKTNAIAYELNGGGSSQTMIVGNSFDGQTQAGVLINPSSTYRGFMISGNYFAQYSNSSGYSCVSVSGGAMAFQGTITGNTCLGFTSGSTNTGFSVNGLDWIVSGNVINNVGTAVSSTTGTNITVGPNQLDNATTPFVGGGTNLTLQTPFPMTYAQMTASTIANGSVVYATDANTYCSGNGGTGAFCYRQNGAWIPGPLSAQLVNYIASETGAANAIAGSLPGVALVTGLRVTIQLAHTLQAGADTFAYNGGAAVAIKSSRNTANNIATAYAAAGTISLFYDGTQWEDQSQ